MRTRWIMVAGPVMAYVLALVGTSFGALLHQWEFEDASGTALGDAVDSVGAASWVGGLSAADMATDGAGSLLLGHTTNTVDASLPLPGTANGSRYVRIDYRGWDLGAANGGEQVSFYLEGSGNVRMELLRWAANTWNLTGWSPPDLGSVNTFSAVETGPLSTLFELDVDALRYRIWWENGLGAGWSSSPWSSADPGLEVAHLRFRKAGDFSQAGDAVAIDRITVADQLSDVIDLPPHPENLVAGWTDTTASGVSTAPGIGLMLDVEAGGASFDPEYNCSDHYYGPDGNASFSTGPDDLMVSAVTFQSNQYLLVTITNAYAGRMVLEELRFDWGARFNGSPRFFDLYYAAGSLDGVAEETLLWSIRTFPESPTADADVDDYNDAAIDLTPLADHTLDDGEFATFRIEVSEFGDEGKSLVDNLGFFGLVPPPVVSDLVVTTVPVPVETLLFDIGNDISYRGLSVQNPDPNGHYWNSVWSGAFYLDVIDLNGATTDVDFGFSMATGTDSYNGPAGPTDAGQGPLTSVVENTDIDVAALGNLGVTNAAFDFYVNSAFEIQGLDQDRRYNLTFYGSHKFHSHPTTVYSVYGDAGHSDLVASTSLVLHEPGSPWLHNRDTVATLTGLSPQTNGILYVKFAAEDGSSGYLNSMQVEATIEADVGIIAWESKPGTVYNIEQATDLAASNWTEVVSGLVGTGGSLSATVMLASALADLRVVEEVSPPPAILFFDDFESGTNGWTRGIDGVTSTQWELGAPSSGYGPAEAHSGTRCWGTNLDAQYDLASECWLRSPAIDLTSVSEASLGWHQAVDIEGDENGEFFDWGQVNILDANDVVLISGLGGKFAGEDDVPPWEFEQQSLNSVVGNVIRIEYRFTSDEFIRTRAGWYLDDVEVTGQ